MKRNLAFWVAVILTLNLSFSNTPASASSYMNPILHEVVIDHDSLQATLYWTTLQTSEDDSIDDYAYTIDGRNFISLIGQFNQTSASESQTTTVDLPARANSSENIFGIAKIIDNRISGTSQFVRGKINEQPIPVVVDFKAKEGNSLVFKITNYNSTAVAKGNIRYRVSQIRLNSGSKVSVKLSADLIYVSNYSAGERIVFKTIKYVLLCNGFTTYLSCPYNSKTNTAVDWSKV